MPRSQTPEADRQWVGNGAPCLSCSTQGTTQAPGPVPDPSTREMGTQGEPKGPWGWAQGWSICQDSWELGLLCLGERNRTGGSHPHLGTPGRNRVRLCQMVPRKRTRVQNGARELLQNTRIHPHCAGDQALVQPAWKVAGAPCWDPVASTQLPEKMNTRKGQGTAFSFHVLSWLWDSAPK